MTLLGLSAAAGSFVALTPTPAALAKPAAPPHVTCKLITLYQNRCCPGESVQLGLDFTIQKKWHIYSNLRNDNGFPPGVEWELPAGYKMDPLLWPAPVRHIDPGDLLNHVYFDHVTLPVVLHVPATAPVNTNVKIKAKVKWLVCDTTCIGEEADVLLDLIVIAPGDVTCKSPGDQRIRDAQARLPYPPTDQKIEIGWPAQSVTINVPGATHLEFFPEDACLPFASPIKDPVADGPKLTIALDSPEPEKTALVGVLEVRRADKPTVWYQLKQAPPAPTPPTAKPTPSQPSTTTKTTP